MADLIFLVPGDNAAIKGLPAILASDIETREFTSPNEVLWELQQEQPKLMVADLDLPGISGLDLAELAPNFAPDAQIVLCIPSGDKGAAERAEAMGVKKLALGQQTPEQLRKLAYDLLGRKDVAPPAPKKAAPKPAPAPEPAPPPAAAPKAQPDERRMVFTEQMLGNVRQRLQTLSNELGTQQMVLSDRMGVPLVELGRGTGISLMSMLPLLTAGFTTAEQLEQHLGEQDASTLYFHEGSRYDIYAFEVARNYVLTLIFDKQIAPSKIGPVWVYTKRAIKDLLDTLE